MNRKEIDKNKAALIDSFTAYSDLVNQIVQLSQKINEFAEDSVDNFSRIVEQFNARVETVKNDKNNVVSLVDKIKEKKD